MIFQILHQKKIVQMFDLYLQNIYYFDIIFLVQMLGGGAWNLRLNFHTISPKRRC